MHLALLAILQSFHLMKQLIAVCSLKEHFGDLQYVKRFYIISLKNIKRRKTNNLLHLRLKPIQEVITEVAEPVKRIGLLRRIIAVLFYYRTISTALNVFHIKD